MTERAPRGIRIRSDNSEATEAPGGTYLIDVQCENCDWAAEVGIPRGTPIKRGERVGRHAHCGGCGCHTLIRCEHAEEPEVEQEAESEAESDAQDVRIPIQPSPASIEREFQDLLDQLRRQSDCERFVPVAPLPDPMPLPMVPEPTVDPRPWRPGQSSTWIGDPPLADNNMIGGPSPGGNMIGDSPPISKMIGYTRHAHEQDGFVGLAGGALPLSAMALIDKHT
jgi:hypothetical protein